MSNKFDFYTAAIWTTLAGAGGAVRYISSRIQKNEEVCIKKFFFYLFVNCFMSGFSGLMLALVATTMTDDMTVHLIASGMGGYLGIEVLNILSVLVKSRISKP